MFLLKEPALARCVKIEYSFDRNGGATLKAMKSAIVAAVITMSSLITAMGAPPQELVTMLDKTGYPYTKIDNNIWEIQFKGDNLKEFPVRIIQTEDVTVLMTKLADRKDLVDREALYLRLLEL
ncbi:MAG TPA: hypothetical protein VI756_12935, partial [Blastocatellia bacterium]